MSFRIVVLLWGILLSSLAAADLPRVVCDGRAVCREASTHLPLMVLPRSFSHLYKDQNFQQILQQNVAAFVPLYVFSREVWGNSADSGRPQGKYMVARSEQGPPVGWMRAEDVLEWRQALTAAFTHPGSGEESRQRALMFRRLEDLETILASDEIESTALGLYQRIDSGDIPDQVLSKEPESFVDISRTFYLLPIVDARLHDLYGDEVRLVRLASAMPGERADTATPDVLTNKEYRRRNEQTRADQARIRGMGVDLVFVMDMTRSMQPYIDRTKAAMKAMARYVSRNGLKEQIRFGLVGFRDDIRKVPALRFIQHNFTPQLVDVDRFIQILDRDARAAKASSPGYSEDVFAGVEQGLNSAWRGNTLRFMVLVGDASGHPPTHSQSSTRKDENVLRMAAQDLNVHIMGLQLLNPRFPADQGVAEAQFARLSEVRGGGGSALTQVRTDQVEDFQKAVEILTTRITQALRQVQQQGAGYLDNIQQAEVEETSVAAQTEQAMQMIIHSAMVEYLGQDAKPPRDLLMWTADRDLTSPDIRTLDIRVLLTREQLSDLILALDRILQAMLEAKMTNMDFFDSLQGLAVQSMKRPEAIGQVETVRQSGLVPKFIESLPYRSEVLALDRESYASLTAEQRAELLSHLTAKLNQYVKISEMVDGWTTLSPQSGDRKVFPLQLDYLP